MLFVCPLTVTSAGICHVPGNRRRGKVLRRLIVARDLKMQGIDGKGSGQLFNLRELMCLDLAQLNVHGIFRIAGGCE
jgi:hypothetical protein